MFDTSITLRSLQRSGTDLTDEYGNLITETYTDRNVYAEKLSVGMKEFYEAAASGFKPEIKFRLADCDEYKGEQQVIYNGTTYKIVRTFIPDNRTIEITCEKGL